MCHEVLWHADILNVLHANRKSVIEFVEQCKDGPHDGIDHPELGHSVIAADCQCIRCQLTEQLAWLLFK